MNVKTLTFIHKLLTEEVEKRTGAHAYIREIANTAAKEEKPNAEYLKQQKEKAWDEYMKAYQALSDFESQEW